MEKTLKPSQLMLRGWEAVGKQCYDLLFVGSNKNPISVCAIGAANYAAFGIANACDAIPTLVLDRYYYKYGCTIQKDNDINKLTIPQIAAKLEAIGY